MKKTAVRRFFRAAGFLCLMVLLIVTSSYMLAPKDNTAESGIANPNANGFFSEPKNTIDIAVIGNSDAYSGFSPMELWKQYGYTSYVSAEGHQSVAQAYSQLKKILKCHEIKVLILETDSFFTKSKLVENAAKMINAAAGSPFSVFQYHDRWKKVRADELLKKPNYTAHCLSKGQWLSNDIKSYNGGEYMVKTDKAIPIPRVVEMPLNLIVKTCRDKGIRLVLLELPSKSSWNYQKHNAVQAYADKNDLPFLDLNLDRDRFGFDWKTDTRDKGNHLNNCGARKCTLFIGSYLSDTYRLSDHRGDSKYARWNQDYEDYSKKVKI